MIDILASDLVKNPGNSDIELAFKEQLKQSTNSDELRKIAEKYTPHTEVSIPIYKKILELHS